MAKPLQEWLDTDVEEIRKKEEELGVDYLYEYNFPRDPKVPIFANSDAMLAPASGIIFNQKEVNSDEELLDIKGKKYTLKDVMFNKDFNKRCLVIQTFLTYLDVHITRMPYSSFVKYKVLPPLKTRNLSMIPFEDEIFSNKYNSNTLDYSFYNERAIAECNIPSLEYKYYMVLIGDLHVNVINFFCQNNKHLIQGKRFGQIRFGSEVDLILPIEDDMFFDYELVHPNLTHVESGEDTILNLKFKRDENKYSINYDAKNQEVKK